MLLAERLPECPGTRKQALRSQDIVPRKRGTDPSPGRDSPEPRVEPEHGDPKHDSENDNRRAGGLRLLAEPPLALVQQVGAKLVHLPLQIDVTGSDVHPACHYTGHIRPCPGALQEGGWPHLSQ